MRREYPFMGSVCRGAVVGALFVLVSFLTFSAFKLALSMGHPLLRGLEPFVIFIFASALIPFIYNSVALAFAYSDSEHINEFLTREDKNVRFGRELLITFSSLGAMAEIVTTSLFVAMAAMLGAFPSVALMFPFPVPAAGLCPAILLAPICFTISLLSRFEAARYFYKLDEDDKIQKLLSPMWLVGRALLILVLYPITSPFVPIVLFAAISLFSIFAKISALLTVLGMLLGIAALILLIWGIRVLSCISKRKKFIKRLALSAKLNGYELKYLKTPYRSFATAKDHCSFTLSIDDEIYDCIMISTLWRSTPFYFTSPTDAYFLHRFGTENHNFSLKHNIEFYHTGGGKRIIIIDPVPKYVFVSEFGKSKRVYSSDDIWNITVYEKESFIGCMERRCLNSEKRQGTD